MNAVDLIQWIAILGLAFMVYIAFRLCYKLLLLISTLDSLYTDLQRDIDTMIDDLYENGE